MPTAIEHINRALYLIGASSPIKPSSPETIEIARQTLNDMAYRWADQGIEVGLLEADMPGEEVQSYEWASPAIQYSLALELADILQVEAPPSVSLRQVQFFEEMRRRVRLCAVVPRRVQMDGRLPRGTGNDRGRRYGRRFYPDPHQPRIADVQQPPVTPPEPTPVMPRTQVVFPMLARITALPQSVQNIGNLVVMDVTLAPFTNDQVTAPGLGPQVVEKYRICDANGTPTNFGSHIMYLDDNVTQQNFSGTLALWVEELG